MNTPAKKKVLVTGASGFIGRRIVSKLLLSGHEVVAFVRSSSNISTLQEAGVAIAIGDITDAESLNRAAKDMDVVVHAAADTEGTEIGGKLVTLGGTKNVLGACQENEIEKLLYISSCSVYDMASVEANHCIDEDAALEPRPADRGPYSQYKLEAENLVTQRAKMSQTVTVVLRPGAVYGPGTTIFPAMLGFSHNDHYFVVIGMGKMCPPWVHVENVAEAVCLAVEEKVANGEIFNLVDAQPVSKRRYIDSLVRKVFPGARVFYLPYFLVYVATVVQEFLFGIVGKEAFLTRYRLVSSQNPVTINGSRIRTSLDWQPSVDFDQTVEDWGSHRKTSTRIVS